MTRKDDWGRSAARENARRTAAAPLLAHAGLVPLTSPAERQAKIEAVRQQGVERARDSAVRAEEQLVALRAVLVGRVGPGDLARVDRYLAAYPKEVRAGMLERVLARLDAGLPPVEDGQAPTEETVAEWRRRGRLVVAAYNETTPQEQGLLCELAALTEKDRRARRVLLARLSEMRGQRVDVAMRAAGVCVRKADPQEEPLIGVRVTLGQDVHEVVVPASGAPCLTLPVGCACGAHPLPVRHGMVTEGPGGLLGQALCGACNTVVGRLEAWWL